IVPRPSPCKVPSSSAPALLPPPLLRLALHRWRFRVLELQPILRSAGSVARPEPLRHDALEAYLAGVPEYALAIVGEVLVQTPPGRLPRSRLASVALRSDSRRRSWPSSSRRSKA